MYLPQFADRVADPVHFQPDPDPDLDPDPANQNFKTTFFLSCIFFAWFMTKKN